MKGIDWRRGPLRRTPSRDVPARESVRGKLLRIVLLTTAVALSITGLALLTHELYVYRTSWAADLSTEAAILAVSTAPALAFDDRATVARNLNAFEARRRVMMAAVYTPAGRLYESFVRKAESPPPMLPPRDGFRVHGEHVEIVQPVVRGGERLGTIYLSARYDLAGRIEAYAVIFAMATLLSMALAFFLSKRLQRGITQPLDAIVGVARAVVHGRDYSLRAAKFSDDEIGIMVDAFNTMLDEVQSRTRAMSDADRRKDEFLATLAHELRNPLAPIRHAAKLLEAHNVDERQRQWAREVIARQVQRMALLLEDLLDVSRITRGRLDLKVQPIEVEALIRAAVETARPLIDAKQHRLRLDLPDRDVTLAVDPLRMSQSLSNLLTNAAKYTDPCGQITLQVRVTAEGVAISVTDNGIGFEPHRLPELFEMFSQVDSADTRAEGGLGIGLALVKGLVALHGGTIEGSSAGRGAGSAFTIHLPRSTVVDANASAAEAPHVAEGVPGSAPSLRVLVADDNRDSADSLGLLLQMNGHDVRVVHRGKDALRSAIAERPQAVILDIGMPDMSGYEVARRLRAEPWGDPLLLIAVTGWGQKDDRARAAAAGFDHHLTKPVDPDEVERLIQAFCCATPGHAEAAG